MKKMFVKAIAATALVAAVSSPAYAWGDREQGILTGIAGTILWQQITQPRVIVNPQPGGYPGGYPGVGVPGIPPVVPYYPHSQYPGYTYRPMYRMVDVFFPECQCYRSVPVQVN